jgi:hypothetical protein
LIISFTGFDGDRRGARTREYVNRCAAHVIDDGQDCGVDFPGPTNLVGLFVFQSEKRRNDDKLGDWAMLCLWARLPAW